MLPSLAEKLLLSPPDLIQASQDQTNVNVPQMVDTLMERVGNASWVVVFKALITTHHLMVHGHEVSAKHTHTHCGRGFCSGGGEVEAVFYVHSAMVGALKRRGEYVNVLQKPCFYVQVVTNRSQVMTGINTWVKIETVKQNS